MANPQTRVRSIRRRLDNTFRGQLTVAGQLRNTFEAEVPHDTTLERLLEPSFWWPVHAQVRPLDHIEVTWEDGSRVVRLRCMGVDDRAETVLVEAVPGSDVAYSVPDDLPEGHSIVFVSKGTGWRILQAGRNAHLRGGFSTALEAYTWLMGDRAQAAAEDADAEAEQQGGGKKPKPTKPKPAAPEERTQPT